MGFFDIFKRNEKEDGINNHPDILYSTIDHGSHGDNIGGLIGFQTLNSENGVDFINDHIIEAVKDPNPLRNSKYSISTRTITSARLGLRVLREKMQVLSAFPYLKTQYVLPFTTKEIIEWHHVNKTEAEIKGGGRNTFGLDFFPTDYAINRKHYHENKEINIHVSAFAFVLDEEKQDEINEQNFSKDFVAYIPSSNLKRQTYYDFIGKVIDSYEVTMPNLNAGYIAKIRLINDDSNPDFFTIDIFVNKENMRIDTLEPGMKVSGMLWFQGELADSK